MFIELLDKSLQPPIEKLKYNWKFPHGHRWTPVGRKNWEGAGRGKGESRDSARRIWGKLAYLQFSTFFWKPSKYFDCVSFLRFSRNTHLKYHAYHFPDHIHNWNAEHEQKVLVKSGFERIICCCVYRCPKTDSEVIFPKFWEGRLDKSLRVYNNLTTN